MKNKIELGDRVKHKITGFQGIVISYVEYLTGCDQVGVKPETLKEDGLEKDCSYFDITMVNVLKKQVIKPVKMIEEVNQKTGGPQETPSKNI